MLLSIAVMLISGMLLGWICKKMHLPALLGMIFTGMLLGPYALDYIDGSILSISAELRKIALIIILARAGLSLDVADLKKVGRPAVLMCFLPACFEIFGMILLAPGMLGITVLDAAILGAVVGRHCSQNADSAGGGVRNRKKYSSADSGRGLCRRYFCHRNVFRVHRPGSGRHYFTCKFSSDTTVYIIRYSYGNRDWIWTCPVFWKNTYEGHRQGASPSEHCFPARLGGRPFY